MMKPILRLPFFAFFLGMLAVLILMQQGWADEIKEPRPKLAPPKTRITAESFQPKWNNEGWVATRVDPWGNADENQTLSPGSS